MNPSKQGARLFTAHDPGISDAGQTDRERKEDMDGAERRAWTGLNFILGNDIISQNEMEE